MLLCVVRFRAANRFRSSTFARGDALNDTEMHDITSYATPARLFAILELVELSVEFEQSLILANLGGGVLCLTVLVFPEDELVQRVAGWTLEARFVE